MATWQKVITSGSVATLAEVTASAGFSGDGSGLTGISADSLANSLVDGNGIADFTFNGSAGATVAIDLNGSTLNLGSSGVKVADAGITATQIATSVAGSGLAGGGGTALSVGVDGSTVEINSDAVRVKDAGITMAKLANIATDTFIGRTASGTGVPKALSKTEALAILNVEDGAAADQDLSGLALKTAISGAFTAGEGIDISSGAISGEDATASNKGIAKFNTANFAVSSGDITIKDGGVAMAELANIATDTFIGRTASGTGVPKALSKTEALAILNVADGAAADQDLSGLALKTQISGAFTAGEGIDISSGAISGENATTSNKGIASFDTNHFVVSSGAVTVKASSIATGDIANNAVTGDKLADDVTIAGSLTVTSDLIVSGDTVTVNTANLNVEDQFILLNSGSNSKDVGIIFGGTTGTNNTGKALLWDHSYNGGGGADGRLAVSTTAIAANNTTNFGAGTAGYYIAGVFEGSAANAATAKVDHNGNIRIESNEIYIYA